jgi:AraC-like DNA-binding protein
MEFRQANGARQRADGYQRIGPITSVPQILAERGVDAAAVLSACGLAEDALDVADGAISFTTFVALIDRCTAATQCSHFGLLIAEKASVERFGVLGALFQSAGTMLEALSAFVSNHHRYADGDILYAMTVGSEVTVGYSLYHHHGSAGARALTDIKLGTACTIIRQLSDLSPKEVLFSREPPVDITPYSRLFRAPIRFNAESSALIYDRKEFEKSIPSANPVVHDMLKQRMAEYWAAKSPDITRSMKRSLFPQVLMGPINQSMAAKAMAMTPRTLNRRLKTEGTSFREQIAMLHQDLGDQLLMHTSIPITQISMALGYSAPSIFTRACRRWSGMTPSELRSQARHRATDASNG